MPRHSQHLNHRQRGSSYIEFLILAPVLLLLAGWTIEVARFVRFRQIADVISKEAALEAYRSCDITNINAQANAGSDPVVDQQVTFVNIQNCLNNIANKYQATVAAAGINDSAVVLSLYRYDFGSLVPADSPACSPANGTFTQISTSAANSGFQLSGGAIRSRATNAAVGSQIAGCQLGRILISEMAFRYNPVINYRIIGINQSFDTSFNNSPLNNSQGSFQNAFRETTIL